MTPIPDLGDCRRGMRACPSELLFVGPRALIHQGHLANDRVVDAAFLERLLERRLIDSLFFPGNDPQINRVLALLTHVVGCPQGNHFVRLRAFHVEIMRDNRVPGLSFSSCGMSLTFK